MKLACIAFTGQGLDIAGRIKSSEGMEADIYDKSSYKSSLDHIFTHYDHIVFISATGIAVRLCAPYLQNKSCDPGIVVIDDLGRFCISLVSGHLGGANELAIKLSGLLKCRPVITTASDSRGIEAVDMFAKANGLYIESLADAKKITAMMLEGRKIKLESELKLKLDYDNISDEEYAGVVLVSSVNLISKAVPCCILRPRNLNVGLGCRRGKSMAEILEAITEVFDRNNLSKRSIKAVATVDIKADEQGIIDACRQLGCDMKVFERASIAEIEAAFQPSEFVRSRLGVASVCEPCACLTGGKLIVNKAIINGITIAVSRED